MTVTQFLDGRVTLHAGDCREMIRAIPDASIDSVVCDPPYALVSIVKRFGKPGSAEAKGGVYQRSAAGFMGKQWDNGEAAFAETFWAEVLRVLKPGGHVLAFSGTRTYHRLAVAIEDAGFEIRDQIGWAYGSGFPKSHDVSKGIDKKRDDRPDVLRITARMADAAEALNISKPMVDAHMGTSDMAGWWLSRLLHRCQCPTPEQWDRLKCLLQIDDRDVDREILRLNARKGEFGTGWNERAITGEVEQWDDRTNYALTSRDGLRRDEASSADARRWQGWGTALKPAWEPIVMARKPLGGTVAENVLEHGTGALNIGACRVQLEPGSRDVGRQINRAARTDDDGYGMNRSSGDVATVIKPEGRWPANIIHDGSGEVIAAFPDAPGQQRGVGPEHGIKSSVNVYGDYGARDDFQPRGDSGSAARFFYSAKADADDRLGSKHPTVKPLDLMQYLVRLVTPPGGIVLDPFAGTGTTGEAAFREGMRAVLIEREPEYQADIARRMELAQNPTKRAAVAKSKNKLQGAEGTPLFDGDAA